MDGTLEPVQPVGAQRQSRTSAEYLLNRQPIFQVERPGEGDQAEAVTDPGARPPGGNFLIQYQEGLSIEFLEEEQGPGWWANRGQAVPCILQGEEDRGGPQPHQGDEQHHEVGAAARRLSNEFVRAETLKC